MSKNSVLYYHKGKRGVEVKKWVVDLEKLKQLRKRKMSLDEMSIRLGYSSPNGYFYLENGRTKLSANKLGEIAIILEVPIAELFKLAED